MAAGAALTPVVFAAGDDSGSAPDAGTDKGTTPEKFPATRAKTVNGTGEATTAFAASYVGVRWQGGRDGVDVLFANGKASPGTWQPLTGGCATVEDGGTALVAAGDATAFEVKASADATGVRCRAVDTTDGPKRTFKVPSEPTRVRGVRYLSRPAWGADESKRFLENGQVNSPEQYFPLQCVTVHHTATPNDDPDPAATVRAIYDFHAITNDWGDIGYHFLIDEAGNVYEGRYSGDDGIPAFDRDGNVVTGFHTGGFNSGNLGIAPPRHPDRAGPHGRRQGLPDPPDQGDHPLRHRVPGPDDVRPARRGPHRCGPLTCASPQWPAGGSVTGRRALGWEADRSPWAGAKWPSTWSMSRTSARCTALVPSSTACPSASPKGTASAS
ncbi:N-acetylmuramoyl-L-alanine amidase [Streptomyces sp. NPDC002838]|uniref:N-acetylmuramoyl-L-alanine amidase n=1 Tax=Streptomyces sp. NPDC002838 TaxID=3154436 RepID=UPI00332ABDE4